MRKLKRRHSSKPLPLEMGRECPVCGWEDEYCGIREDTPYCMGCGQLLRESTADEYLKQKYSWYKETYGWNKRRVDKEFEEREKVRKIEQEQWERERKESGLSESEFFEQKMVSAVDKVFGGELLEKVKTIATNRME